MAITYSPIYPVPAEEVTIVVTGTTGTAQALELTSTPNESELLTGILTTAGIRQVTAQSVIDAGTASAKFTPDVPGPYVIKAYDFIQTIGVPAFAGDPSGEAVRKLAATQTGTVHVGGLLDLPITTAAGHGVTLRLTSVDTTIRAAELVSPSTEVARVAALNATVLTKLAALVGVTVDTIGEDIVTRVADMRAKHNAHVNTGGPFHSMADTASLLVNSQPTSVQSAIVVLNELLEKLGRHLLSHTTNSHQFDDLANAPGLVGPATSLATATVLAVDLGERVYERHRVSGTGSVPPIHQNAGGDTTNALAAPSKLAELIVAYLDEVAVLVATVAATEPEGATKAGSRYGFKRA